MTTDFHPLGSNLTSSHNLLESTTKLARLIATVKCRYIRTEIAFWMFAIPLLQESRGLHRALALVYPMYKYIRWFFRLPKPVLWVLSGLSLGFMIGFVGGLILP